MLIIVATTIMWWEPVASTPAVSMPASTSNLSLQTPVSPATAMRFASLRCMCNVGVNFPITDIPKFRKQLFLRKIGLIPTPGDLYDLVPWTWLVGWIADLGSYIHLMDRINGSASPINYGFMTYKSVTQIVTTVTLKRLITIDTVFNPASPNPPKTHEENLFLWNLSNELDLKYELRLGIGSLAVIPQYSGSHLSSDQKTILGALFAKFT
jgi:hypothetical protein